MISLIRKNYITKCEKLKDREDGCAECRACGVVEFLENYIELVEHFDLGKKPLLKTSKK